MAIPDKQLGAYRLIRRIGSGGMAEVYLAERGGAEGFSRSVAIKTIVAQGADGEAIDLFLDEARLAALLEHPAIVQTLDLGYENQTLFIAMEYVAGPPISRIIRELKKQKRFVPNAIVAHVGARVASALDYAYARAVAEDGRRLEMIHRDISPQNILLTRGGMVKLTDFGVARASVQTHRTRTGQVRGKAAYMAPEQVRAKTLDGRTDIFALGIVLYEALTGIRPFQRKTDINSMRAILTDDVQPIREVNRDATDDLVRIVMKALEKDPSARWQSAHEMADALRQNLGPTKATVEAQIAELIEELFGHSDTFQEDEGRPVEAWQPTIAADARDAVPRLPSANLSPQLQMMLTPIPEGSSDELTTLPPNQSARSNSSTTFPGPTRIIHGPRGLNGLGLPILGVLVSVVAALTLTLWRKTPPPLSAPPPAAPIESNTTNSAAVAIPKAKATPHRTGMSRDEFKARVLAASKAHKRRGNDELADALRAMLQTIESSSARPSAADQERLQRAERGL